jgi:hypothetical protein
LFFCGNLPLRRRFGRGLARHGLALGAPGSGSAWLVPAGHRPSSGSDAAPSGCVLLVRCGQCKLVVGFRSSPSRGGGMHLTRGKMLCSGLLVGSSVGDAFGRRYLRWGRRCEFAFLYPASRRNPSSRWSGRWRRSGDASLEKASPWSCCGWQGLVAPGGWSQSTTDLGLPSSFVSGRDVVVVFFLHWIHVRAGSCGHGRLCGVRRCSMVCLRCRDAPRLASGTQVSWRRLVASDLSTTPPMLMVSWRCVVSATRFR